MLTKEQILNSISDMIADYLYYDRKEDHSMPQGSIEEAIENDVITIEEIVVCFEEELRDGLK